MFYDEAKAIKACEEEPSLIFELIREEHYELVDFLLTKGKVDINTCDELGNNVLVRLLKKGQYDLVLKHMKNKKWDINHQNNGGDTFAHILVVYNYVNVLEIINELKKNKNFIPNIKNCKGETILDKSINDNYIYTTIKILDLPLYFRQYDILDVYYSVKKLCELNYITLDTIDVPWEENTCISDITYYGHKYIESFQ